MKVHSPHPLRSLIDRQHEFLSSLIDRFPSLLHDWMTEQEREVDVLAKESSSGIPELYILEYASEIQRLASCGFEEDLFEQAMLIMVFSYYESLIYKLSKETGSDNRPRMIAEKMGTKLDEEFVQIADYLYDTIRPLRNELCHNNNGTLFLDAKEKDKAKVLELEKSNIIKINNGQISIIDKTFISKTLDKEHRLLVKLADICGFR